MIEGEVEYVDVVRYEGEVGYGYVFTRLLDPDDRGRWIEIKQPVAMLADGGLLPYMLQGKDKEYGMVLSETELAEVRKGWFACICQRCGKPIAYKVDGYDCDGGEEFVSDGYFEDGRPQRWFHTQCEEMKPLKRHLLPWISIIERLHSPLAR